MDGYVEIGVDLDTQSFDKQIAEVERELKTLTRLYEGIKRSKPYEGQAQALKELGLEIEKTKNKLISLKKRQQDVGKTKITGASNSFKGINSSINDINNSLSRTIARIGRWAVALLGVRTIYGFLSQAASTVSQYNEKIGADINYIKFALATTLQPVIETLISLVYKLLGAINYISINLFKVNLLARATTEAFENQNKATAGTVKQAKELKKTLAGFDEMNILQDTGSSDSGSGGGSAIVSPSIDLSNYQFNPDDLLKNWNLDKFIEKGKEIATNIAKGINDTLEKTDFVGLAKGFSKALRGLIQIIVTFIQEIDWQLVGKSIGDFLLNIDWLGIFLEIATFWYEGQKALLDVVIGIMDAIIEKITDPKFVGDLFQAGIDLFMGLLKGFVSVIAKIGEALMKLLEMVLAFFGIHSPSTVFAEIGQNLMLGLVNGIQSLFQNVINIFINLINSIKSTFGQIVEFIKGIVDSIVSIFNSGVNIIIGLPSKIKDTFASAMNVVYSTISSVWNKIKKLFSAGGKIFDGMKDGIVNSFKAIVNALISGINKAIAIPFNKVNSLLNTIRNAGVLGVKPFKGLWSQNPIGVPKIPKLAKGGIINNPGKGVFTGSAIAGEAGREFYMPLQDEQMLSLVGEAIGKYITINANITNTMNGRVISRELQRVQNDRDFAYNR